MPSGGRSIPGEADGSRNPGGGSSRRLVELSVTWSVYMPEAPRSCGQLKSAPGDRGLGLEVVHRA